MISKNLQARSTRRDYGFNAQYPGFAREDESNRPLKLFQTLKMKGYKFPKTEGIVYMDIHWVTELT